jgi:sodium-dependent dicarboxylate transporter 2/3/5
MASIGIFLGSTVLFVTQPVPIAISCLTIMILLPILGVSTYQQIFQDFGGNAFFFILFSFGITAAITPTDVPLRMAGWIMKISKGNSKVIVYAFAFSTMFVSGVVSSNFAPVVMFAGVALAFLKNANLKPRESNLGRCLMITLPIASGIGGFITPASTSTNMVAIEFMNKAGLSVRFVDWFLISTPFAILTCFFSAFLFVFF